MQSDSTSTSVLKLRASVRGSEFEMVTSRFCIRRRQAGSQQTSSLCMACKDILVEHGNVGQKLRVAGGLFSDSQPGIAITRNTKTHPTHRFGLQIYYLTIIQTSEF